MRPFALLLVSLFLFVRAAGAETSLPDFRRHITAAPSIGHSFVPFPFDSGHDFGLNLGFGYDLRRWFEIGGRAQFHILFGDVGPFSAEFLADPNFHYRFKKRISLYGGPTIGFGYLHGSDSDGSFVRTATVLIGLKTGVSWGITKRFSFRPEVEYLRLIHFHDHFYLPDANLLRFNLGFSFSF